MLFYSLYQRSSSAAFRTPATQVAEKKRKSEVIKMEEVVPCSSIAVDSALRIGTAGAIWGLCISPHDARGKGLTGAAKASFVAKSVGRCSFQCGLIAGVFQMSHCWIEQYRGRKDWKNSVIAGAVGAATATAVTGIRKWDVMVALACVLSGINAAVEFSRTK